MVHGYLATALGLNDYCRDKCLDPGVTWVDYVNKLIAATHDAGKQPVMWADHPSKDETIAKRLSRNVTLAYWHYSAALNREHFERLLRNGHNDIILSPALAWCHTRFFPPQSAFDNLETMLTLEPAQFIKGSINTIWCPWRYLQNTLYYGIARSAETVRLKEAFDVDSFNKTFASRFFRESNNSRLLNTPCIALAIADMFSRLRQSGRTCCIVKRPT